MKGKNSFKISSIKGCLPNKKPEYSEEQISDDGEGGKGYGHFFSKESYGFNSCIDTIDANELELDEDVIKAEIQLRYYKLMYPNVTEDTAKIVAEVLSRAIAQQGAKLIKVVGK